MSLRKAPTDPIVAHEPELLSYLNSRPDDLDLFALYFAQSPKALQIQVSDIDSTGFTLQYVERTGLEGNFTRKEVRVVYDRATTVADVKKRIDALKREAKVATELVVDRSYVAPGSDGTLKMKNVMSPMSDPLKVILVLGWIILILAVYGPDLPTLLDVDLEAVKDHMGGRPLFLKFLVALAAIHAVECVLVLVLAVYGALPLDDVVVALVYVALFGVHATGPFVKMVFKRKAYLDGKKAEGAKAKAKGKGKGNADPSTKATAASKQEL
ncbi:hypothetical protein HKX48_001667 [Thoreauomyces humboldtii]|nr:hypothetical protein HKX48_001667 [Thoreauomyces humboldtii]